MRERESVLIYFVHVAVESRRKRAGCWDFKQQPRSLVPSGDGNIKVLLWKKSHIYNCCVWLCTSTAGAYSHLLLITNVCSHWPRKAIT